MGLPLGWLETWMQQVKLMGSPMGSLQTHNHRYTKTAPL